MTSIQTQAKVRAILDAWGQTIRENLYSFADFDDEAARIFGVREFLPSDDGSRLAAQSRQVFGSLNRIRLNKYKWFMLFDDDTWINLQLLAKFLKNLDYTRTIGIGFLYNSYRGDPGVNWFSGGGGMLYTSSAYTVILDAFARGDCTIHNVQDLSMSRCAQKRSVRLLHSPLFHFHRPMSTLWNTNEFYRRHSSVSVASALTFHYIKASEHELLDSLVVAIDPNMILL